MTRNHCCEGELCLQGRHHADIRPDSISVKGVTGPVTGRRVMSGPCDRCYFMQRVEVTATCWLWMGSRYTQYGKPTYGQTMFRGERTGAHRVAFMLWKGDIPEGLDILHSCDVKACVNPGHLRVGTHQENIREAFAKLPAGHFGGERNGRARLTWEKVRAMRADHTRGASQSSLSAKYGVSQSAVSQIVRGVKWPEPTVSEKEVAA